MPQDVGCGKPIGKQLAGGFYFQHPIANAVAGTLIGDRLFTGKQKGIAPGGQRFNAALGFGAAAVHTFGELHDEGVGVGPLLLYLLQFIGGKGQMLQKSGGAGHGVIGHI